MTPLATITPPVELDHRTADGLHVSLLWRRETNTVSISVVDEPRGDAFEVEVPNDQALDAFHHPYWYAARDVSLADYLERAYAA